ncbi:EcsC family protein [Rubellimicrobium sp. CFH 75288]|uniref:EcsC family protein n=1 Tax=Rubellimicrobium sp. CFH 75288 TaxID=2697034 RepID=UPI00352B1BFB
MRAVNMVGNGVEDALRRLPKPLRARIDRAAMAALLRAYALAARSREEGEGWAGRLARLRGDGAHKALAAVAGAVGGAGGLPTALMELPLTTALIFRAVQAVAEANGEDPAAEETRMECLRVFGSGGPDTADEGVNTAFLGARLSLTGGTVQRLVAVVAPRFGAVFGQKLAGQAVPLVGAAAGAGTNWAFTDYYVEVAHVHFGLRRLARVHGEVVYDEFHRVLAVLRPPEPPVQRA